MKRVMLAFIIIISMSLHLKAQTTEFAPIGASWWYDQYEFTGPQNSYWVYTSEKDTLIGGNMMRKVIRKKIQLSGTEYTADPVFYYQDGNKIFIKDHATDTLRSFFDFDALPGDTIKSYSYYADVNGPAISIVDSVKSIMMGSAEVQAYYLHNKEYEGSYHAYFTSIFYSIGPYEYPFPTNGLADPPEGGALRCYEDADIGLLKFTTDAYCEYIVSVQDDLAAELRFYPNPVTDKLILESAHKCNEISIMNMSGEITSPEIKYNGNTILIDLSNLPEGIYLVLAYENDNLIISQKISKQ